MTIRAATYADFQSVVQLVLQFFKELPENVDKKDLTLDSVPLSSAVYHTVMRFLMSRTCLVLLGETEGQPTAIFIVELVESPWTGRAACREQLLYIAPSERDGKWLEPGLQIVDAWARENDATHMLVAPTKSKNNNMLAELLTRHGFEPEGSLLRRNYEQQDTV